VARRVGDALRTHKEMAWTRSANRSGARCGRESMPNFTSMRFVEDYYFRYLDGCRCP
jgi:hypothetical protein